MKKIIAILLSTGVVASGFAASSAFVINEFVASHAGTDNREFIEIFGAGNSSLASLSILQIEGDSTSAGIVDSVIAPGSTNADGYWTTDFLTNVLENGSVSFLLVENFTGAAGTDLDTDNDGVLDATPWSILMDAVAVSDGGADDRTYGGVTLNVGYDGVNFSVGGASRLPNGIDTDATGDWVRNDFDLAGLPGFTGTLVPGEALNTPNAVNAVPEPATLAALALGAIAMVRRRKA